VSTDGIDEPAGSASSTHVFGTVRGADRHTRAPSTIWG
jgi:hypothetical protein